MAASQHHTEYAPPVIRSPSPTSSIGTAYDEDQTTETEKDLSWSEFEFIVQEKLQLFQPREEELLANRDPLISRPDTEPERQALFYKILGDLGKEVQQLEENDLYEKTLLRGSQVALQPQPTTTDIDALMKTMMGLGMTITDTPSIPIMGSSSVSIPGFPQASRQLKKEKITPGPWNNWGKPAVYEGGEGIVDDSLEDLLSGIMGSGSKRTRRGRAR